MVNFSPSSRLLNNFHALSVEAAGRWTGVVSNCVGHPTRGPLTLRLLGKRNYETDLCAAAGAAQRFDKFEIANSYVIQNQMVLRLEIDQIGNMGSGSSLRLLHIT